MGYPAWNYAKINTLIHSHLVFVKCKPWDHEMNANHSFKSELTLPHNVWLVSSPGVHYFERASIALKEPTTKVNNVCPLLN